MVGSKVISLVLIQHPSPLMRAISNTNSLSKSKTHNLSRRLSPPIDWSQGLLKLANKTVHEREGLGPLPLSLLRIIYPTPTISSRNRLILAIHTQSHVLSLDYHPLIPAAAYQLRNRRNSLVTAPPSNQEQVPCIFYENDGFCFRIFPLHEPSQL